MNKNLLTPSLSIIMKSIGLQVSWKQKFDQLDDTEVFSRIIKHIDLGKLEVTSEIDVKYNEVFSCVFLSAKFKPAGTIY